MMNSGKPSEISKPHSPEESRPIVLEKEFEGSPVDLRIELLTDWADEFFSGSTL
ncbi:MAG: hypothetical protein VST70_03025 [Nitrospirota bacterium]|nr:hypothetical protein [Nitrospirota bacterium]